MTYRQKVERVFADLKSKGKVTGELEPSDTKNFRSSLFSDKIFYNPDCDCKFDEDSIHFILLHEQAHKNGSENTKKFLGALGALIGLLYLPIWLGIATTMMQIGISLGIIVGAFGLMILFSDGFHEDEFKADRKACEEFDTLRFDSRGTDTLKKLIKNYRDSRPSHDGMMKNVLHPPDKKRIEHLDKIELEVR